MYSVPTVPTVTVSDESKDSIEQLRKDMPFINNKVSSAKTTVELALEFVAENRTQFIAWLEKRGGQKR